MRHQRVARIRRLIAKKSLRTSERAFVAEGPKVVESAMSADAPFEAIYVDSGADLTESTVELLDVARTKGIRVFGLDRGVMERVGDAVTPQPLLAVVGFIDRPLADLASGNVLVLVDVRDPGNVGAIIRSADAAGIDAIVVCDGCGDIYNPKTVRASAGSLFHLPLVRAGSPTEVLGTLDGLGFSTVAMVARDGEDYSTASLDAPVALVFGNEARGLEPTVIARCSQQVTIPIAGGAESLNVAMAATVVSFELARRRRTAPSAPFSMRP